MNILVCISHVPDTTFRVHLKDDDTLIDTTGVSHVINPDDEYGLNKAIELQTTYNAKVTVLCVGDASCEPTLRKALAAGADAAIRIDMLPKSGRQVAYQLVDIVKNGAYDLIITGRESVDYNGGMMPGALAALSGSNLIDNCVGLDIDGGTALAIRETDNGRETVSVEMPLIISAKKGLVEDKDLRIPNMRGIMTARQKPLKVLPPKQMESHLKYSNYHKVERNKGGVKIIDKDNLDELAEIIRDQINIG